MKILIIIAYVSGCLIPLIPSKIFKIIGGIFGVPFLKKLSQAILMNVGLVEEL